MLDDAAGTVGHGRNCRLLERLPLDLGCSGFRVWGWDSEEALECGFKALGLADSAPDL